MNLNPTDEDLLLHSVIYLQWKNDNGEILSEFTWHWGRIFEADLRYNLDGRQCSVMRKHNAAVFRGEI